MALTAWCRSKFASVSKAVYCHLSIYPSHPIFRTILPFFSFVWSNPKHVDDISACQWYPDGTISHSWLVDASLPPVICPQNRFWPIPISLCPYRMGTPSYKLVYIPLQPPLTSSLYLPETIEFSHFKATECYLGGPILYKWVYYWGSHSNYHPHLILSLPVLVNILSSSNRIQEKLALRPMRPSRSQE